MEWAGQSGIAVLEVASVTQPGRGAPAWLYPQCPPIPLDLCRQLPAPLLPPHTSPCWVSAVVPQSTRSGARLPAQRNALILPGTPHPASSSTPPACPWWGFHQVEFPNTSSLPLPTPCCRHAPIPAARPPPSPSPSLPPHLPWMLPQSLLGAAVWGSRKHLSTPARENPFPEIAPSV